MAGSINRDDIASVRERAPIEEIIGAHVALKSGGVGSLKGLCPFHDERTPSFHVRPGQGHWHCFGCGEGGDVIAFVMKADGLPFAEAVEYLADRAGVTLRYEAGGQRSSGGEPGMRKRLLEAHRVAAEYFVAQLETPEAKAGRDFLQGRGFGKEAAETFGVGYAPKGWSNMLEHLRAKGFTEPEFKASGLVSEGQRGIYDRFRGRLVWPIRAVTGEVIGFGARKLYEDDEGPKYLNTPETAIYKKSQVLYGLDLAKKKIAGKRQVVVVEGYTDVMACHLAGVDTAVATCGTAFGEDHAKVIRRLMGGASGAPQKVGVGSGEVIFTFDGDEAGQNAALKTFQLESQFLSQTFVAVAPDGLDPCDLRQEQGDKAVAALVASRVPLFEFVIKAALAGNNLESAEGRVAALRAAAPVVAGIKDRALQPEYARLLAGWLGMDHEEVRRAVGSAARSRPATQQQRPSSASRSGSSAPPQGGEYPPPDPGADPEADAGAATAGPDSRDPVVRAERLALEVILQIPAEITAELIAKLSADTFTVPQYRAVFEGVLAAGGIAGAGSDWTNRVVEEVGETLAGVVSQLAVSPLPHHKPAEVATYATSVLGRVWDLSLTRQIADVRGRMQRIGEGGEGYQDAFAELIAFEGERRALRED